MNDVLQWVAILVVGLLALGAVRQSSLGRTDTGAESGPKVGRRLPRQLTEQIVQVAETRPVTEVAFVTESCRACQRLIASLDADSDVVVAVREPTQAFVEAVSERHVRHIAVDAQLWRDTGVAGTPLLVRVDTDGRIISKGARKDDSILAK